MSASDFDQAMAALFAHLEAAVTLTFTGNATATNSTIANVSNFAGLFAGLPVFGPGVSRGVVIQSLDAVARTVTLSAPLSAGGTAVGFTTGFLTTGRRLQHWSQVSAQPAMFLRRIGVTTEYSGHLQINTIEAEVWIYSQAGKDPDAVPEEALSNLDDLVRESFAPDIDERFTLGGLVYWCRIEGRSDYSPGDQGGQGICRLPVRITLP